MAAQDAKTYVIGLRRGSSSDPDLADRLQALPEVEVVGDYTGTRAVIRTTPSGLQRLQAALGDRYHIEEAINHRR